MLYSVSESYKETPEDDERRPFFERAATLPSPQRLDQLAQGNGNMKPRLSVSSHKVDTTLDLDEGEGKGCLMCSLASVVFM